MCFLFTAFNIELAKESYRRQFFFIQNVSFSFSAFLEFGRSNQVSLKLVYRPQTSSRSSLEEVINVSFSENVAYDSQISVMYKLLTFEASVNNNLESFTKHCNGTVTLITCGKVTSVTLK